MPLKYHHKLGLMPGFSETPEVRKLREQRKEELMESRKRIEAKRSLMRSGFQFDRLTSYLKNFTTGGGR